MERVDYTIIGAGVVGLAIAEKLSSLDATIYVIEKETHFGAVTSSRNSEVIHSGIYYKTDSLKHRLCVEGNKILYDLCKNNNINHRRTGKLVFATDDEQISALHGLYENSRANGVETQLLDSHQINELEPQLNCKEALYVPSTGIIDSHALMQCFYNKAHSNGVELSLQTEVIGLEKISFGFVVNVKDNSGEIFSFKSNYVINCGGLESDTVASLAGIDIDKVSYRLKYCKGSYFSYFGGESPGFKHLLYPAASEDSNSLGIHACIDLGGRIKFGPDEEYLGNRVQDYDVPESKKNSFYDSIIKWWPSLNIENIAPDMSGVRPKLQGPEDGFRDFIIKEESSRGLSGLINLIGIESPGLTASPAIAEFLVREYQLC